MPLNSLQYQSVAIEGIPQPPEMYLMEPILTGYLDGIGLEVVKKVHSW